MDGDELMRDEKDDLLAKMTELLERNVLKKDDYVMILAICSDACKRRIAEIDDRLRPEGRIQ